jgi:DNA mismatch repair ATPase MutS
VGIGVLAVFIVVFTMLVIKHLKLKRDLERTQCKIKINQAYNDRISGRWTSFKDTGMDFVDSKHPFSSDLDIFGRSSLFQWINIGNTFFGRTILRDLLISPTKNKDDIINRQKAVNELASKKLFTEELQCEGMLGENIDQDPAKLLAYFEGNRRLFSSDAIKYIFYILPIITVLSVVAMITGMVQGSNILSPLIPLGLIILQLVLTAIGYVRSANTLSMVNLYKAEIEAYGSIIQVIEKAEFNNEYLKQLQGNFASQDKSVAQQLQGLDWLVFAISFRSSALLNFLLNALLLWDYHCIFKLENWKQSYGKGIRKWLETIGEFEALSSLAVVKGINPTWCNPDIVEVTINDNNASNINSMNCVSNQQPTLTINKVKVADDNTKHQPNSLEFVSEALGHPLIASDKRVYNDFAISNNLGVITGSNMSGKTTLLRTVGINLVLAYAGAPVCADKLRCSMMDIFTSMRITDDLNSGISSFYAELLRIKMIIEHVHTKQPMLFLIDEIFRGTNSKDRILGARSVLRNLSKPWVIGLISTHDFELCDLENEKDVSIKNYHFTEHYIDDEIKFDYKLRSGRCHTTNAKYLMKMVGITFEDCKQ